MLGIVLPYYMLVIAGGFGKVPVGQKWISESEDGYDVTDFNGETHKYK